MLEFDLCLNHFGVFLKQQEMSKLIKEYQGASKDEIDYVLFLKSLRVVCGIVVHFVLKK